MQKGESIYVRALNQIFTDPETQRALEHGAEARRSG